MNRMIRENHIDKMTPELIIILDVYRYYAF